MQYILNAAFDVQYFMYIYLTSFFIINLEVTNFVISEILSIFSSTVFILVNNIFSFFYKWPIFPPHYTFSFFQKVMTEIKRTNKWVGYKNWCKYIYIHSQHSPSPSPLPPFILKVGVENFGQRPKGVWMEIFKKG